MKKGKKMVFGAGAHGKIAAFFGGAARLCKDRRGVAAIEFAFIAPLLLAMYFVTMEVSQGIETSKKVSRIGSMVADLVTQQPTVSPTILKSIMMIGEATIQPYNRSKPKIFITAIAISTDATPQATVEWSRRLIEGVDSAGAAPKSITTVPDALRIPGTHLIRVESILDYQPVIAWAADSKPALGLTSAFSNIGMNETYYLRPRMSTTVECKLC